MTAENSGIWWVWEGGEDLGMSALWGFGDERVDGDVMELQAGNLGCVPFRAPSN